MVDSEIRRDINRIIQEDLWAGDVTTNTVLDSEIEICANISSEKSGKVVGISEMLLFFQEFNIKFRPKIADGDQVEKGEKIAELEGSAKKILKSKKSAVNILSHMSGVATITDELISEARDQNENVQIAATRDTTPLLRRFEKRAVEAVGGEPHRYHLGDFILITRDHMKIAGGLEEAIERASENSSGEKIEVEVQDKSEAKKSIDLGADILRFSHKDPDEIKTIVDGLKDENFRDKSILEAYGNIDHQKIKNYASTDVDIISTTYITTKFSPLPLKINVNANSISDPF